MANAGNGSPRLERIEGVLEKLAKGQREFAVCNSCGEVVRLSDDDPNVSRIFGEP